ncbi:MAG: SMP-30/gluconolactonase/LRE family protein [Acidimicrobiia bacterium]|nr:SMP-30/gluconolactonase/LRE family protein [Acidimicrobiia bacterium]MYE71935.1 SMP-30/gluconolactonase/LRE family protein [Acidimicrobiia bacterium]MYJ63191.1 SMP-30/gluconolactonase/LRE family protein [Acidimicrobiia bacterium]
MGSVPPVTVASGFFFPEAPRWRGGQLWFSDVFGGLVYSWDSETGDLAQQASIPGRPSGLGWTPDGDLLVVSTIDRTLRRADGTVVADLNPVSDSKINDMVVDDDGTAYIGNDGFDLEARAPERPAQILRVGPDGEVSVAADGLRFANGMVITPERRLIVAETWGRRLSSFAVSHDGSLGDQRVFAELDAGSPDGICLAPDGRVWVADPMGRRVLLVAEGGAIGHVVDFPGCRPTACVLDDTGTRLFVCTAPSIDPAKVQARPGGEIVVVDLG